MLSFKDEADIPSFCSAFDAFIAALPSGMVVSYESGAQMSQEGLSKGLQRCFLITFPDVAARDAYLPHPIHTDFVEKHVRPNMKDVCVFDYEI